MDRGHNRETLFRDDRDFQYSLNLLARYCIRFGFRLFHYCLMSNYFHLLLQLEDPRRLSRLIAGLLLAYVRYYNDRYGFVGHLFQGRLKSFPIEEDDHFLQVCRYVERNALRAGLAKRAERWPWGSL